ncbi:MAG: UDP-N-acetylmuramoyl-L-alanyl-D-glutamate--2,6-diaminopimelate ligase [Alphaproteobacteria bacterium]|nr:UDP-N-acetylmuramoyl-L-alanyl-D-glutamate--2,6-diaminopimelate ligase [Alphaproteobacteria bacterium]
MRLRDLIAEVQPVRVRGALDRDIARLTQDSREAGPGAVFVALRGHHVDGHRFVPGLHAEAVVVEEAVEAAPGVTVIEVADTRVALARMAAALYGHPSRALSLVGFTGTNGKTSSCWIFESIAQVAGWPVGVIGTTGNRIRGEASPARFTTPMPPEWQALLARMRDAGCTTVAAEVSSFGLAGRRVDATRFKVAVYTNLSQDHLDIHGTMEAYAAAKARLFTELLPDDGVAVLNIDDPVVAALPPLRAQTLRFGLDTGDLRTEGLATDLTGARFLLKTPAGDAPVQMRLVGRHNVENALAAAGAALALGATPAQISAGLAALDHIPGRLERVGDGEPVVLVDYAHTDDALTTVLGTLRPLTRGRVLIVFGCGGDRDRAKRPIMARAATEGADVVLATSDNPRSEDPLAILEDMRPGLGPDAILEPDRARAIHRAVRLARPGDVVLIAGKGHETTQEIAGEKLPFDDREVALAALRGDPCA